jgi:hypothetical protein
VTELPTWVWDMLIELEEQREIHPKLLHQSGLMTKPEPYDWCSCALLDKVPREVTAQAQAIRAYAQAKAREAAEMGA